MEPWTRTEKSRMFAATAASICAMLASGMSDEPELLVFFDAIIGFVSTLKLVDRNRDNSGHGVDGTIHILGVPWMTATLQALLTAGLMLMWWKTGTIDFWHTNSPHLRMILVAILCGQLASLAEWFAVSYRETYYEDEYWMSAKMRQAGYTESKVQQTIADGRRHGIYRPIEPTPE